MSEILVTLPDGSERAFPKGATAYDVAASIGPRLAKAAVAAAVDGEEWDLDPAAARRRARGAHHRPTPTRVATSCATRRPTSWPRR